MVSAYAIEQIQVSAFCVPSTKSVSSKHCCRRDLFTVYSQKRQEHVSQTNKIFAASTPTTSNADTSISMQSEKSTTTRFQSMLCAIALAVTTASSTSMTTEAGTAFAYIPSDYASETVTTVIQDLKSASGKNEATFNVYENIAGIITEGKGVGGMINYSKLCNRKEASDCSKKTKNGKGIDFCQLYDIGIQLICDNHSCTFALCPLSMHNIPHIRKFLRLVPHLLHYFYGSFRFIHFSCVVFVRR